MLCLLCHQCAAARAHGEHERQRAGRVWGRGVCEHHLPGDVFHAHGHALRGWILGNDFRVVPPGELQRRRELHLFRE